MGKGINIKFDSDKIISSFHADDGNHGIMIQEAGRKVVIGDMDDTPDRRIEDPNGEGHHILCFVNPKSIDVLIDKLQLAKSFYSDKVGDSK